jgi:dihydroorotate dehydrogenase
MELARSVDNILRAPIDLGHREIVHRKLTAGEAQRDREISHERALDMVEKLQSNPFIMEGLNMVFAHDDPILKTRFAGLTLPSPIGFAAGFDKNARIWDFLFYAQGFGYGEVGSVTFLKFEGNPRPRIHDLPNNDGLSNRMGFPGDGVDEVIPRLPYINKVAFDIANLIDSPKLIVNHAASKPSFEQGKAFEHSLKAFELLLPYGYAHTGNESSPNTAGVRGIQEPEVHAEYAAAYEEKRAQSAYYFKPVGFKYGPELEFVKLYKNIRTDIDHGINYTSLTNTTTDPEIRANLNPDVHKDEIGGVSGQPLKPKALERSHRVYLIFGDEIDIKYSGGIQNGKDVWDAFTYGGAKATEALSGYVRPTSSTPNFAHYIKRDLAISMRMMGMTSMEDFKELRGKRVPYPLDKQKRFF